MRRGAARFAALVASALLGAAAAAASGPQGRDGEDYEALVVATLERAATGDLDGALEQAEAAIERFPNGRLGLLLYGDLLASAAGFGPLGEPAQAVERFRLEALREEARLRWRHNREASPARRGALPAQLLAAPDDVPYLIFVDLSDYRLYLYDNGADLPRLVTDWHITMGLNGAHKRHRGDKRTPVGVYRVTGWIDGAELPERYGPGAFPIDYPNAWDRRQARDGYGIWLHGTPPETWNRAPRESDGCVVLSNADLLALAEHISPEDPTPVIIAERTDWLTVERWRARRDQALWTIERWRRDWERRDAERLLAHYDPDYKGGPAAFSAWAAYKRRVLERSGEIRVQLRDLGVYAYPGEPDLLMAEFEQRYTSESYSGVVRKQQFWRRGEDGRWRIVYEAKE